MTRLDEFRTRELENGQIRDIRDHLDDCPECETICEEIEEIAAAAPALMRPVTPSCADSLFGILYDRYDVIEIDQTPIRVTWSPEGITEVTLADRHAESFREDYGRRRKRDLCRAAIPAELRAALETAFRGVGARAVPIDLSESSEFERKVLDALRSIPRGEVRTYAWIAREAGRPRAVRAAGSACARNPIPFIIPCHRVVPSSGGVGNYAYGTAMKRDLLEREGVPMAEIDAMESTHARYVASRTTGIYCFPTCPDARRIREENRILVRDEKNAEARGLRPCRRCRPLAA